MIPRLQTQIARCFCSGRLPEGQRRTLCDAVLRLVACRNLYRRCHDVSEGDRREARRSKGLAFRLDP